MQIFYICTLRVDYFNEVPFSSDPKAFDFVFITKPFFCPVCVLHSCNIRSCVRPCYGDFQVFVSY